MVLHELGLPSGVDEAFAQVDALDAVLLGGFARVPAELADGLRGFGSGLAGSPLGAPTQQAIEALLAGELLAHHLTVVAAAREAVLGAVHDALLEYAAASLALELAPLEASTAPLEHAVGEGLVPLRQWLVELALAGLGQLDRATLAPMVPGLRALQQEAGLERVSALATGMCFELLGAAPTNELDEPSPRRWADLWSRTLLATAVAPPVVTSRPVAGRFAVLGVDLRHHSHLVSAVVHGILDTGEARHLARAEVSTWKVDAVAGVDAWALLGSKQPLLIDALRAPATLTVEGRLSPTGHLEVDAVGPSATHKLPDHDLAGAMLHRPAPTDRHPVQLGIPVRLDGVPLLPVADERLSPLLDLDETDLTGMTGANALLRFDGGWRLQPIAAWKGRKLLGPVKLLTQAAKAKAGAADVLGERASKLLRA